MSTGMALLRSGPPCWAISSIHARLKSLSIIGVRTPQDEPNSPNAMRCKQIGVRPHEVLPCLERCSPAIRPWASPLTRPITELMG